MGQDAVETFRDLITRQVELEGKIEDNKAAIKALVSKMDLSDVVSMYPSAQIHTVWENGNISVVLLVSKGKFGDCGILLWGKQLQFNPACLAFKVYGESVAQFSVFDGNPGSESFHTISSYGGVAERRRFIESLEAVYKKAGVSRVYAKNAKFLESGGALHCVTEEIEHLYMKIARADGTIIPEFGFFDPRASSAFWSNNG